MGQEVINLLLNGSVSTIIGVAVIVVCYKVVKLFFDNQVESRKAGFQKDIEYYKNELEKEKNAFMIKIEQDKQRFQAELDKQLSQYNIIFGNLNTERFRVTNKIFGLLLQYYDYAKAYTDGAYRSWEYDYVYPVPPSQQLQEGFIKVDAVRLELWKEFVPNRLYYSTELADRINDVINLLNTEIDKYKIDVETGVINDVSPSHIRIRDANSLITDIEHSLRTMLGVS